MERLHSLFVEHHNEALIQKVTSVIPIADALRDNKTISLETHSLIQKASADAKMTVLLQALSTSKARSSFYSVLQVMLPNLVKELERQDAQFVDCHSDILIQRVSTVMPIADSLKVCKIIHGETYSIIAVKQGRNKMRTLLEALSTNKAKSAFYHFLKVNESFLVNDLKGQGVKQEIPVSSAQTSSEILETEYRSQNMEILQMQAIQQRSEDKQITWRKESSTIHSTKIKELLIEPDLKNIGSLYFYKDEKYMIGSGGGGTQVYIGMREDGIEVAIKIIPKNPKNNKDFKYELKLLQSKKLESKNIVIYMTFVEDKDFYYLGNQLCEYDLVDYMEYLRQSEQNDKKETLKKIANEMLLGLQVLHHAEVIHRDIKPGNVLIDLEGRARLADFGISRKLEEGKTTMYTDRAGTQGWEATEIVNQTEKGSYKKSSDIQVAGMLTYYILSDGKHPFGDGIRREVNISEGIHSLGDIQDIAAKDLVEWMINKDKDERPTIDKVLNHPYFWDDKRKEGVIMKLGERNEVQYYINISKICETKKAEEGLTAKDAVERTLSEKKDISRKTTILTMLGETEEDQNRNLENLSKLCDSAKKCTQGKTFNKWKSELSGADRNLPEDILGLLRTYCNKMKHDVKFEKKFDRFPDFFTTLYRLALDEGWDYTWS